MKSTLTASLTALTLALLLHASGVLDTLNGGMRDFLFTANLHQQDSDLVLVEIDARSLRELAAWPWPRSHHARVIDQLSAAGAQTIGIDLDMSTASSVEQDQALAHAIQRHTSRRKLLLPVFQQSAQQQHVNAPTVITRPLELFITAGASTASVNVTPDHDGLVRSLRHFPNTPVLNTPSLAVALGHDIPLTGNEVAIDYSIHPGSFLRLSYADIYQGNFDPEQVNGKTVLIGSTAIELGDQLATPLHRALPGMIVQALAYQSLHNQTLLHSNPVASILLATLTAILISFSTYKPSWRTGILLLCVTVAGIFMLAAAAFAYWRLMLPVYSLSSTAVIALVINFIRTIDHQGLTLARQRRTIKTKNDIVQAVFHNSIDPILTVTADGRISTLNNPAAQLIDNTRNRILGTPVTRILPNWDELRNRYTGSHTQTTLHDHAGHTIPVEIALGSTTQEDPDEYILILQDITERLQLQQSLEYAATHDALTELPNRRALHHHMNEALEQTNTDPTPVALLLLDLDHFKEINDTLGHATGDDVLRQLSTRFRSVLPNDIMVARIGGDEFAFVTHRQGARTRLEDFSHTLFAALQAPLQLDGISISLNASAGISVFPDDAVCAAELLQHADVAMYKAKEFGRTLAVYDEATNRHSLRRLSIISQLKEAIHSNQLSVHYQPKVDTQTQCCIGAEALVRWQHPVIGTIPPAEFIPLAEQTGNIDALTTWVMDQVFTDIRKHGPALSALRISINLSGRSLAETDCADHFLRHLQTSRVSPDQIGIEVTESAAMDQPERAISILNAFQAAGIQIELDDYGTGYSSLSYLQRLPIHTIKLDRSLIMDITHSKTSHTIVAATIDMAHRLGYTLVAEGVEDNDTLAALADLGCEKIQGYLFSKPLPLDEFLHWLQAQRTHLPQRRSAQ